MDDLRAIVRVIEGFTKLSDPVAKLMRFKDLLFFLGPQVGKCLSIDKLHGNAAGTFVVHKVVNPNDMRMAQFQAALCLTFELIQQRTTLDHQARKKFYRDVALQFSAARLPHDSHPAAAEHLDQRVAAKDHLSAGSI